MSSRSLLLLYSYSNIKSVLSVFITIPLKIMENTAATQLDVLIRRLNEAERRAKLLKFEVKSIRNEISTLQQSVTGIGNGNSNGISGNTTTSRLLSCRNTIVIDDSPQKNEVDGLAGTSKCKRTLTEGSGPSQVKKQKADFNKENDYVIVYTDGACENNGKRNAKAGIGVWFGDEHPLNVSKPVEGRMTNNTAEIQACVQALKVLQNHGESKVKIHTDSEFTINCMTKWIKNWKKNNWKTSSGGEVKNKEDLQVLDGIIKTFKDVQWVHVAGHRGIKGNEEADKLAREGAQHYRS